MVVVIKMKGLPWEATAREIRQFYRGLDIREEDIHLAPSPEGKASGYAFACFHKDDEARKAMHRHGNFVGKRYIELILSSQTEMEKILKEGVRKRGDDVDKKRVLAGQTDDRKANNLRDNSRSVRDALRRSRSRSPIRSSSSVDSSWGRKDRIGSNHATGSRRQAVTNGTANGLSATRREVVRRTRESDRRRDSDRLGRSSASYSKNSRESRLDARSVGSSGSRRDSGSVIRGDTSVGKPNRSRRESSDVDGVAASSTWVFMTGLPYTVTESEIRDFFQGLDVLAVHLMLHSSGSWLGKLDGTAYVEFKSVGDCIQGADRNRQFIRERYVGVKRCTVERAYEVLNVKLSDSRIYQEPNMTERSFSQEDILYSLGNMNGNNHNLSSPEMRLALDVGINAAGNMPIQENSGVGTEGPMTPVKQLAAGANISVNDISAGCVIGIRNLPSTVSAEEILDFFYGFPIIPDSIRIHYLAPGRSSGDAMVTLPTNGEARSAIEQLNNKPVGKRKVQLFLV